MSLDEVRVTDLAAGNGPPPDEKGEADERFPSKYIKYFEECATEVRGILQDLRRRLAPREAEQRRLSEILSQPNSKANAFSKKFAKQDMVKVRREIRELQDEIKKWTSGKYQPAALLRTWGTPGVPARKLEPGDYGIMNFFPVLVGTQKGRVLLSDRREHMSLNLVVDEKYMNIVDHPGLRGRTLWEVVTRVHVLLQDRNTDMDAQRRPNELDAFILRPIMDKDVEYYYRVWHKKRSHENESSAPK